MRWPVTQPIRSDAMAATAAPMSSGWPTWPIAITPTGTAGRTPAAPARTARAPRTPRSGRRGRAVGVAEAGHVRHDHVERVGGVGRVGEQRDDLGVPPERVGPAVAEDQRQGGPGGAGVDEVDPQAADRGAEAREAVQRGLLRGLVAYWADGFDWPAQVFEVGAQGPPGVLGRVGPTGGAQSRAQVREHVGGGLRGERLGHGSTLRPP